MAVLNKITELNISYNEIIQYIESVSEFSESKCKQMASFSEYDWAARFTGFHIYI